jgi:hypothetical protein
MVKRTIHCDGCGSDHAEPFCYEKSKLQKRNLQFEKDLLTLLLNYGYKIEGITSISISLEVDKQPNMNINYKRI